MRFRHHGAYLSAFIKSHRQLLITRQDLNPTAAVIPSS